MNSAKTTYARAVPRYVTSLASGSLTDQSYRDDNNPNNIMRRYNANGEITGKTANFRDPSAARFLDVPGYLDAYKAGMETVLKIEETFMSLPVAIRADFNHDPTELLQAMEDPLQRSRLEKLGIVNPPPKPEEKKPEEPKK